MSRKRRPAKIGERVEAPEPDPVPLEPRRPADNLSPIPVTGVEEIIENLDEHSAPTAWLEVCRIQYVQDQRARPLEWWHHRVWIPNGCPLTSGQLRYTANQEDWDGQRTRLWRRVADHVFDLQVDQKAEEALTAQKKYRAVEAVMLEKLTPKIVVTDDGEELELKIAPKSYEGMVRALVDLKKLQIDTTNHMMELLTGGRQPGESDDSDGDVHSDAKRRVFDFGRLREIADELALQEGKGSDD